MAGIRKLVMENRVLPEDAIDFVTGQHKEDNHTRRILEAEGWNSNAASDFAPEFSNSLRQNTMWAITTEDTAESPALNPPSGLPTRTYQSAASKQAHGKTTEHNSGGRNSSQSDQPKSRMVNGRKNKRGSACPQYSSSDQSTEHSSRSLEHSISNCSLIGETPDTRSPYASRVCNSGGSTFEPWAQSTPHRRPSGGKPRRNFYLDDYITEGAKPSFKEGGKKRKKGKRNSSSWQSDSPSDSPVFNLSDELSFPSLSPSGSSPRDSRNTSADSALPVYNTLPESQRSPDLISFLPYEPAMVLNREHWDDYHLCKNGGQMNGPLNNNKENYMVPSPEGILPRNKSQNQINGHKSASVTNVPVTPTRVRPSQLSCRDNCVVNSAYQNIQPFSGSSPNFSNQGEEAAGISSNLSLKISELTGVLPTEADPLEVTYKDQLDRLALLYSICIQKQIFPNLSSEVYFVGQLLTANPQTSGPSDIGYAHEEPNCLCSIHNIVYFAVRVVCSLTELLKQFDKSTLMLFGENKRLKLFSPDVHWELKAAYENMDESASYCCGVLPPLCQFEINENIHKIKVLKDTFPEMMRTWEEKEHSLPRRGQSREAYEIQEMFAGADVTFYICFSRVFVHHLFLVCQEQMQNADDSVGSMGSDKSMKLNERLTKASDDDPCPPSSFPGKQKFFQHFLKTANNYRFNQHVKDVLITQIHQLDNLRFGETGMISEEDVDTKEVGHMEDRFKPCVLMLKTFSRFLGFLTFAPYHDLEKISQHLQGESTSQRNLTPLPLDLVDFLEYAIERDRLALTVPWIVEFLAMMDPLAQNTRPVRRILAQLHCLLRKIGPELHDHGYGYEQLLLVTSLGWLFEQPSLEGYYFSQEVSSEDLRFCPVPPMRRNKDFVTRDFLYSCCPYFYCVQRLLCDFSQGKSVKSHPRKINLRTPFSGTTPKRVDLNTGVSKKIQQELLENFCYHTIPRNLFEVVEKVSNLIYDTAVKHFTKTVLEPILQHHLQRDMALSAVPNEAHQAHAQVTEIVEQKSVLCSCSLEMIVQFLVSPDTSDDICQCLVQMIQIHFKKRLQAWLKSSHSVFFHKLKRETGKKADREARAGNGQHAEKKQKSKEPEDRDSRSTEMDGASNMAVSSVMEDSDHLSFTLGGNSLQAVYGDSTDSQKCLRIFRATGEFMFEIPLLFDRVGSGVLENSAAKAKRTAGADSDVPEDIPYISDRSANVERSEADANHSVFEGSPFEGSPFKVNAFSVTTPKANGAGIEELKKFMMKREKKQQKKQNCGSAVGAKHTSIEDAGDCARSASVVRVAVNAAHHSEQGNPTVQKTNSGGDRQAGEEADSKTVQGSPVRSFGGVSDEVSVPSEDQLAAGSAVYVSREMQELLWSLQFGMVDIQRVVTLLLHTDSLTWTDKTLDTTVPFVAENLEQLALAIIFEQPGGWSEQVSSLFVAFWKKHPCCHWHLEVLRTDYAMYLSTAQNQHQVSFQLFTNLLKKLQDENVLTNTMVETIFLDINQLTGLCIK